MTDLAGILSVEHRQRLTEVLAGHEEKTSQRIVVLTVPTLSGESIEAFSLRVANAWALGQKDQDNGILVTVALQEHAVRIELGKGLESKIPQDTLNGIIQNDMAPSFKKADYVGGLEKGVRHLIEAATPPSSSSLNCAVEVRVNRIEKQATVTPEIAAELHLRPDTVGRQGVAMLDAKVVGAKGRHGTQEADCSKLVGNSGMLIVRYEASDPRAGKLVAGEVIRLNYLALAGFAPYGVEGTEVWTFPAK